MIVMWIIFYNLKIRDFSIEGEQMTSKKFPNGEWDIWVNGYKKKAVLKEDAELALSKAEKQGALKLMDMFEKQFVKDEDAEMLENHIAGWLRLKAELKKDG